MPNATRKRKKSRKHVAFDEHDDRYRNDETSSNSSSSNSDDDESGDDLKTIGSFLKNRSEMVRQMFHAVPARHLNTILPDVLKDVSVAELEKLCVAQLDIMSKTRVRHILAGRDMTSSSGTEDTSDSEQQETTENNNVLEKLEPPSTHSRSSDDVQQPDSTSADQIVSTLLLESSEQAVDCSPDLQGEREFEHILSTYEFDFGVVSDHSLSPVRANSPEKCETNDDAMNEPNEETEIEPIEIVIGADVSPKDDLEEGEIDDIPTPIALQDTSKPLCDEDVRQAQVPCLKVSDSTDQQIEATTIKDNQFHGENLIQETVDKRTQETHSQSTDNEEGELSDKVSNEQQAPSAIKPLVVREKEEMEHYDSDSDCGQCSGDELYPPGMEPPKPKKTVPKTYNEDDATSSTVEFKRGTVVPIKTLYKQLKEEKERKKARKPKIYSAKEPIWTKIEVDQAKKSKLAKKIPTGPKVPKKSDLMLEEVLANDESNRKLYNELIDDGSTTGTNAEAEKKIQKPKKKSNILLTDEFLADLDKKKLEHEKEMERKAKLLEQLRIRRVKLLEKERETKMDVKKQFDLGVLSDDELLEGTRKPARKRTKTPPTPLCDEIGPNSEDEHACIPSFSKSTEFKLLSNRGASFDASDLASVSICLGESGNREVKVNKKADSMRRAFTIETSSGEEEGEVDHSDSMHGIYRRGVGDFAPDRPATNRRSSDDQRYIKKTQNLADPNKRRKSEYLEDVSSNSEQDEDSRAKSLTRSMNAKKIARKPSVVSQVNQISSAPLQPDVVQKLELYELEMRARAIKALMKNKQS